MFFNFKTKLPACFQNYKGQKVICTQLQSNERQIEQNTHQECISARLSLKYFTLFKLESVLSEDSNFYRTLSQLFSALNILGWESDNMTFQTLSGGELFCMPAIFGDRHALQAWGTCNNKTEKYLIGQPKSLPQVTLLS